MENSLDNSIEIKKPRRRVKKKRINPDISQELNTNPCEDSQFPFN